jgi:hypothetical protein
MRDAPTRTGRPRRRPRRRSGLGRLALLTALAAPIGLATLNGRQGPPDALRVDTLSADGSQATAGQAAAPRADRQPGPAPARLSAADFAWMFEPARMSGAQGLVPSRAPAPVTVAAAEPAAPVATPALASVRPSDRLAALTAEAVVPLPVPRPAELAFRPPEAQARAPERGPERTLAERTLAERATRGRPRPVVVASAEVDNASFFDKLFGTKPAPATALAYAGTGAAPTAPDAARPSLSPNPFGPSTARPGDGVAVYDISAGSVTLPSGERLEAHSGLGQHFDDPRFVHVRMRGPTPPGTYDLREREALFHGVRAIRLTPVGGNGAIFGRDGLLAHTYMLGPRGDSNGCVSFRNYDRFLQAYLRGEVRRLVVVAGASRGDAPKRLFGAL